MVARTSRRAVAAREESSSPREETFAAAIATPLDAGTSDGEILLNARDSPSEGVDVDERERGDDRHHVRDDSAADDARRALPDWWKKVDRAPIGAHGVDMVIPRGPYQSGKGTTAALKRLAIAEGRSVKVCTTRHNGMRGVLMCKGVSDFKRSGRRELQPWTWRSAHDHHSLSAPLTDTADDTRHLIRTSLTSCASSRRFSRASTRSGDLYAWELCKCELTRESLQIP
ncbi:hypothetical protein BE221DRAFT_196420 [Ostreococcus tauri]|uniref:Uncharacterized protein n=1 Tax=Ostreococcus tauri TaxID=70448 RepID=A0A1Y5I4K8_OSTTA|nr:hypothetical protein BE221DRAFT_196420 [Ostreococcus tauri]